MGGVFAYQIKLAFEVITTDAIGGTYKELFKVRHCRARSMANVSQVGVGG